MRTVARCLAILAVAASTLGIVRATPAVAHPLGNFTVNRYSGLLLTPGHLQLTYVLDMAEIPTFQEQSAVDADDDGSITADERQRWAEAEAREVAAKVALTVRGAAVPLRIGAASMVLREGQGGLPILYFEAQFTAELPSTGDAQYEDHNYAGRLGWKEITVASTSGLEVASSTVPSRSVSRELTDYPVDMLSSPPAVTAASFSFRPGTGTAAPSAGTVGPAVTEAPVASGGSFAALINWDLTPPILVLSLLLAFLFGSIHALGPGHGKTITAAYLVGTGARPRQAVVAGVAVALMHTFSVLALGAVALVFARSFPPERVYPWLGLVTGLVAVGMGVGLLVMRVQRYRRGIHGWHGHEHPWDHDESRTSGPEHAVVEQSLASVGASVHEREAHGLEHEPATGPPLDAGEGRHRHAAGDASNHHGHGHPEHGGSVRPTDGATISRRGLMALAVSGGMLPSPTALVVLTAAIAYRRIGYGISLIMAFSAGLAVALIAVAFLALRARTVVSTRLKGRLSELLPMVSAVVIVGIGLLFLVRGIADVM